jgi:predicted flavoprotein YhiN
MTPENQPLQPSRPLGGDPPSASPPATGTPDAAVRRIDIAIVGAGAAGLFAAAWAGRSAPNGGLTPTIVAVDGARKLGAKILVAGGGRCNVTHWRVADTDFAGSTPPAIRKVLARFTADDTVAFFKAAGVELKREDTGKLFPVTDSARTVLDALVREARAAGAALVHARRRAAHGKAKRGARTARSRSESRTRSRPPSSG